jgi:phage shock protein C
MKWVRAKDGVIFGVAKGIARALDLPIGIVRLLWALSALFFGAGIGIYLLLAISLPREDRMAEALQPWLLGVCAKISRRADMEVGIVRFLTICLSLLSMGATFLAYIVLYFVLDRDQSSDNNPSTPPPTTKTF